MLKNSDSNWSTYILNDSSITKVGAEAGHKIDFTTAKCKRKNLDRVLSAELAEMLSLRTSLSN